MTYIEAFSFCVSEIYLSDVYKSFDSIAIYTVEIPTEEQKKQGLKEAKAKEIDNMTNYDVYVCVDGCIHLLCVLFF